MAVFGRFAVAALVFSGSVACAAYAVQDRAFYETLTGSVAGLAQNFVIAGSVLAGDEHLDDPHGEAALAKSNFDRIEPASVVTHVEVVGGDQPQRIVLLDPTGREVFTHDPAQNTTVVARDAIIPSITVRESESDIAELRVVTAAPAIEAPAELRQALVDGAGPTDLFYRDDL